MLVCNVASCIADWSRGEERNTIPAYGPSLLLNFLDMVLSAALIKREPNRQRTHHFSTVYAEKYKLVDSLFAPKRTYALRLFECFLGTQSGPPLFQDTGSAAS